MQPIGTSIYGFEDLDIEELNEKANNMAQETAIVLDSLNSLMSNLENAQNNIKVRKAETIERNRQERIFYVTTAALVSLTVVALLLIPTK